jgi:hypothetical protein
MADTTRTEQKKGLLKDSVGGFMLKTNEVIVATVAMMSPYRDFYFLSNRSPFWIRPCGSIPQAACLRANHPDWSP